MLTTTVEFRYGGRGQLEVIGKELHLAALPVTVIFLVPFDPESDDSRLAGVVLSRLFSRQPDDLVAYDMGLHFSVGAYQCQGTEASQPFSARDVPL
jgi:hypothetical protein